MENLAFQQNASTNVDALMRKVIKIEILRRIMGSWIVESDRGSKILHYLRKKKEKIRICMLNNHINYTFIYIYITETSETPTIFHIIILIYKKN